MKRLLVAEQWGEFARQVIPANAHPLQRKEMRRAFYAGAQAVMFRVIAALAPEGEPTDEDLLVMSDLERELSEFAEAVIEGRA